MSPLLYTFRRCPYAIRARMALAYAGISMIQQEVSLKNKPVELIAASLKGTVPVLVLENGQVIDESLDIMLWALQQSDPDGWLDPASKSRCDELIQLNDLGFKPILNNYKYPERTENKDRACYRIMAMPYLNQLNTLLTQNPYLLAEHITMADVAIVPFIRQFFLIDKQWFEQSNYESLKRWLHAFLNSQLFLSVMQKAS